MSNRDGFFIDFTGYKDSGSAHLTAHEDGLYLVRVVDAELVETKKGDPMVNLYYNVVGGPHDGEQLIDRLVLTDKARWKAKKVLSALGIKVSLTNMQIPFKLIIGRTLVIKAEDGEPYNGETRSEIRDHRPGSTWAGATPAAAAPAADLPVAEEAEVEREFPQADEPPFEVSDSAVTVPSEGEVTL